ncbi:hypothetical protein CI109_106881 [Kwoniella shandongensis]|uniref:DNA mismatch repair protein n=1 Tax=Kwoniella shandongensis TaxID=1734106 RepID=A0A5M6C6N1_9TREE|nr:uncharacterized protein CI109_000863 [Kwoniella shandongensis]KAA5530683.1 hypothetical protein CI109_000863 [Kwoniella shandongensis]
MRLVNARAPIALSATHHYCLTTTSTCHLPMRRPITTSVVAHGQAVKKKAIKTKARLSELPKVKLDKDGQPVKALDAWIEGVKPIKQSGNLANRSRISTPVPTVPVDKPLKSDEPLVAIDRLAAPVPAPTPTDEEEDLRQAIAEGIIPNTPLAKEVYINWKRFPDCILLTRVGKFYESYFEPARQLSSILSIKLAFKKYGEGHFPFAGFPVTRLDKYLKILVQDLGYTVVLVEEYDTEGSVAHTGKKLTGLTTGPKERRVYRVVTPGTMVDEGWLNGDESRYLLAISVKNPRDGEEEDQDTTTLSLAYTDASTGEFFTKDTTSAQMEDELARIAPREVVLDRSLRQVWQDQASDYRGQHTSTLSNLFALLQVLGVHVSFADPYQPPPLWSNTPYSTDNTAPTLRSESEAIALLRHHLQYALRESMPALAEPNRQLSSAYMQIDAATLQALEIRHALRPGGLLATGDTRSSSPISTRGTLLSVISKTVTASGHRLLIRTLTAPSTSLQVIDSRLALVQAFVEREELRGELRDMLKCMEDVMRIVQRFRGLRGDGRDIWDVGRWIRTVERLLGRIQEELQLEHQTIEEKSESVQRLEDFVAAFDSLHNLAEKIESSIDETAILYGSAGYESETDEETEGREMAGDELVADKELQVKETEKEKAARIRQEKEDSEWWILPTFSEALQERHNELAALKEQREKLQVDLRKRFRTDSLTLEKGVRYGYHIQMNRGDADKVVKARSLESIGGAKGKTAYFAFGPWSALGAKTELTTETLANAQRRAARELRELVVEQSEAIQRNAELVDELDLSMSFAQNAVEMGWVRPVLNESTELHIEGGRHPSVESSLLSSSRLFTPNSTHMTPSSQLHIITGPNQGGKSTLLRQTAVIAILAQSGSFVPAERAKMGVVDRVFSRVGARDDLWRDRSTFMLEMVETAGILKHATHKSLVIMDEIGRGTTLQAGISIAYATLDHILRHIGCRTLFATHYHELGTMLGYEDGHKHENDETRRRAEEGEVKGREGVVFWCTDVDEVDGAFSYSYKLRPGINHDSHAIKAARLAGMPETFLRVAEDTLTTLQATGKFEPVLGPIGTVDERSE